jgi:putative transposase
MTASNELICKLCGSKALVKDGSNRGHQYYLCKYCHHRVKGDNLAYRMKTPPDEISSSLNMYYEGMSIKAIQRYLLQEHGHAPSTATIYEWIQKYTQYLIDSVKNYQPTKIGNRWIADETVLRVDNQNVWLWDVIDVSSRFILASRLSRSRTTQDAQVLINRAIKTANKHPQVVTTDKLASYLDVFYGKDAEHRQGSPFSTEDNTGLIERFHGTLKQRTKVMRALKNFESAVDFTNGFLAYYNYLRPHHSLNNKTPAEVAGISYPFEDWADVISKHKPSTKIEILHMERDRVKLPTIQVGRPRKRIRTAKRRQGERMYPTMGEIRL